MAEPAWHRLKRLRFSGFRRLSYPIRLGLACIPLLLIMMVLYPVFYSAYSISRQSSCMSNEKQLALGVLQYVQDYDETFPVGARHNRLGIAIVRDTPRQEKFHAGQGWAGQVFPYLKYQLVFRCPEYESKAADGLYNTVSYAYNCNVALHPKQAEMKQSEVIVLLAETSENCANVADAEERLAGRAGGKTYSAAGNGLNVLAATEGATEPEVSAGVRYATGIMGGYGETNGCPLWPLAAPQEEKPRHKDGSLFAFADGHVKWFKPADVSPGDNAADAKQAQNCAAHRAAGTAKLGAFKATFSTK